MIDRLLALGGIAVGGPAMVIMATLFSGGILRTPEAPLSTSVQPGYPSA